MCQGANGSYLRVRAGRAEVEARGWAMALRFCVEQVEAFVVGTTVFPKRQAKNLANILARWSTQRLSKDVHMKLLEVDDEEGTEEDDDDIEDFSLSNEMSGIQERSAGCAFCLTKCKWRSPTSVVVNIAFHAAKPTIRNTIKKHLIFYLNGISF